MKTGKSARSKVEGESSDAVKSCSDVLENHQRTLASFTKQLEAAKGLQSNFDVLQESFEKVCFFLLDGWLVWGFCFCFLISSLLFCVCCSKIRFG